MSGSGSKELRLRACRTTSVTCKICSLTVDKKDTLLCLKCNSRFHFDCAGHSEKLVRLCGQKNFTCQTCIQRLNKPQRAPKKALLLPKSTSTPVPSPPPNSNPSNPSTSKPFTEDAIAYVANIPTRNAFESLTTDDDDDGSNSISNSEIEGHTATHIRSLNRSCPERAAQSSNTDVEELQTKILKLENQLKTNEKLYLDLLMENGDLKKVVAECELTIQKLTRICKSTTKKPKKDNTTKRGSNSTLQIKQLQYPEQHQLNTEKQNIDSKIKDLITKPSNIPINSTCGSDSEHTNHREAKCKILILADEQGQGMQHALQKLMGSDFEVCCVWKSGADFGGVIETCESEIRNLLSTDYLIIMFHFEAPRPPQQLVECQRAMGRLSASVQAVMRASAARCPLYRGTNVSRYAPTSQRPTPRRYGVWWPRDHLSPRIDRRFQLTHITQNVNTTAETSKPKSEPEETKQEDPKESSTTENTESIEPQSSQLDEKPDNSATEVVLTDQQPSTSAMAMEKGLQQKRLYSTVLSMSAPAPLNLTPIGCVRLSQKLVAPGLIKLNPKIMLPNRRPVDNKLEELEKEALEQYKASDESIDTKFRELEKQAVEQYSNSNTSCSSGNSAEKRTPAPTEDPKKPENFPEEKAVDSVVIYSQNFPDLNAKQPASVTNLKNFPSPPLRGEKKEQTHRSSKSRSLKTETQRAASDTDYDTREAKSHKGLRWAMHVGPKKRHSTLCVSDFSSDDELADASIRDAGPRGKHRAIDNLKLSAHGGGDLQPIKRKT